MSFNFQGICSWKRMRCFPPLTSPCASSKSDQWPPKGFLIRRSSKAIAAPWCFASVLGSHGCWLWSQDYMVWPILWNIALWLYEKQFTTWSLASTGYKVLFLFYICINICCASYNYDASKRKPRRDVYSMCMWRKLTWTLTRPTPPTQQHMRVFINVHDYWRSFPPAGINIYHLEMVYTTYLWWFGGFDLDPRGLAME